MAATYPGGVLRASYRAELPAPTQRRPLVRFFVSELIVGTAVRCSTLLARYRQIAGGPPFCYWPSRRLRTGQFPKSSVSTSSVVTAPQTWMSAVPAGRRASETIGRAASACRSLGSLARFGWLSCRLSLACQHSVARVNKALTSEWRPASLRTNAPLNMRRRPGAGSFFCDGSVEDIITTLSKLTHFG